MNAYVTINPIRPNSVMGMGTYISIQAEELDWLIGKQKVLPDCEQCTQLAGLRISHPRGGYTIANISTLIMQFRVGQYPKLSVPMVAVEPLLKPGTRVRYKYHLYDGVALTNQVGEVRSHLRDELRIVLDDGRGFIYVGQDLVDKALTELEVMYL